MIPISLRLRNFMSYAETAEPLCFEGIHVAVLCGENGHGKSALLDAVTWSLWGKSRARSSDDLLRTGTTEMEVELEFALDDHQYRVIRKRQRRTRATGTTDLQFYVLSQDGYRALTEHSVSETERVIADTLHMSYETFTSSSFIQQGRADAFTTSTPAERKRILAEILDLGYFDQLEARARDVLRARQSAFEDERHRVREWEVEIGHRPEHQTEVERLDAEHVLQSGRWEHLQVDCNLARERVARLETLHKQLDETQTRVKRLGEEQDRLADALKRQEPSLAAARQVIARAAEIEGAARVLAQVRADLVAAETRFRAYHQVVGQLDQARGALRAERARIEAHITALLRQVSKEKKLFGSAADLEATVRSAREDAARLAQLETAHSYLVSAHQTHREEQAEKRVHNENLKRQMQELRTQIEEIEHLSATCPLCQQPIDATHRTRLVAHYTEQGTQMKEVFRGQEREIRDLQAVLDAEDAQRQTSQAQILDLASAQARLATADAALAQSQLARERLASTQAELSSLETLLRQETYAPQEHERVTTLERQVKELGYDETRHTALRDEATRLASAESEKRILDEARITADHLGDQVRENQAQLARVVAEIAAERENLATLRAETADYDATRTRLATLEQDLAALAAQRDQTREQLTQARGRVDYCDFLERQRNESIKRQDALMREQNVYAQLVEAFGKKGVPAMIIDTVTPEIEEEANHILGRLTDGRMHVKLETQREARTGNNLIETLDIKISDELGTRSYEMFSGGESFRVNFSLRIALSRLLARRAGTRLQLLVIDEGFGSQDQDGRDRIVEAIQAIQDEFEKILVITHLEDLRERFPVRIEVRKTEQGSQFQLA